MKIKERRPSKKKQIKEKTINRALLGLIMFSLAVIVVSSIFYLRSSHPAAQAKKEAAEIAKRYANLEGTDRFYWFTRKKAYFSLTDTSDKGKEIAVIIPKSGEEVRMLDQTRGLTGDEAKQIIATAHPEIQIERAALGMYDNQPMWGIVGKETNGKLNCYLISFESGGEVKTVKGIQQVKE